MCPETPPSSKVIIYFSEDGQRTYRVKGVFFDLFHDQLLNQLGWPVISHTIL